MKVIVTRVYNLFGELIKSDDTGDVTIISCDSVSVIGKHFKAYNHGKVVNDIHFDFMNYSYEFTE